MVVIGPLRARTSGNLSEREGSQTYLPEQMKHELADLCDSRLVSIHMEYVISFILCLIHHRWRGWRRKEEEEEVLFLSTKICNNIVY